MIDMPPAIVEVYFDSSCTPCRRELPALAKAVGEENIPLAIFILGDETKAREQLNEISPVLLPRAKSVGDKDVRGVLRAAGNDEGILPYARAVQANGHVCAQWRGILNVDRIRALLAACK